MACEHCTDVIHRKLEEVGERKRIEFLDKGVSVFFKQLVEHYYPALFNCFMNPGVVLHPAELSMQNALRDANLDYSEINCINSPHCWGCWRVCGGESGDQGARLYLGREFDQVDDWAYASDRLTVEPIFCVLATQNWVAPPTINLDEPDDGLNLKFVAHETQAREPFSSRSHSSDCEWRAR